MSGASNIDPSVERKGLELRLVMNIGPNWENVDLLRTAILNCISVIVGNSDASNAVGMIVSELLENAIKYGDWSQDDKGSLLGLHIAGNEERVEVDVSSPMAPSSKNYEEIKATIEWIGSFASPQDAYNARIRMLAEGIEAKSKMGLVRIAYEGPCSLSPELSDAGVLHMRATTYLPADMARSSTRSMHINVTSSSS